MDHGLHHLALPLPFRLWILGRTYLLEMGLRNWVDVLAHCGLAYSFLYGRNVREHHLPLNKLEFHCLMFNLNK